ncbi:MAG: A/G-specific adenine glycosylase [Chlamydiales bacterium]|jgi:A/G-specific adenine glycosylase
MLMTFEFDSHKLKLWFRKKKRDLPWRHQPTPYQVWVSEVMLQQTRVETVIPYYNSWMKRFPTIESLAASSQEEVIKLWEGLGYYSRARNLHEGARYVIENFGGELPSNEEDLKKIKGLGPYTIGAILSFAFHKKAAAVDGNVMRVLTRYFMIQDDITQARTQKMLREIAQEILPDEEPWVFNEALIELGAVQCRRKDQCGACPVQNSCKAFSFDAVSSLPYKSKKTKYESLYRAVAVIRCESKILIKRVPKGKLMSDLHELPYLDTGAEVVVDTDFAKWVKEDLELEAVFIKAYPEVRQSFTRFRVLLRPFLMSSKKTQVVDAYKWVNISELSELPFSSGHKKIINHLTIE